MGQTIRVLAIDDEDTVQGIIVSFLTRFLGEKNITFDVKSFNDPVQGLFELSSNGDSYNIILLDVRLPKLNGDEIYNSLIHVNPELLGRVLFITGYADDLVKRFPDRSLNILPKPFRYRDFCEEIVSILKAK